MASDNEKNIPTYAEQHDAGQPSTGQYAGEKMTAGRYLATRIPTLKPPMDHLENPFKLLGLLNFKQWMFFLVAFIGWTWDAFDFFTGQIVNGVAEGN
jgi:MFS transporter, SHS family, lactate transporter